MRTSQLLLPSLFFASSTLAKPFLRRVLHFPRQFTNTTSEMTQTSTDNLAATTTLSSPACIATYTATEDEKCSEVASRYNIQLSTYEANTAADSEDCQDLLLGYRVCLASNATSSAVVASVTATTTLASNGTFAANGTAPSNATITSAPVANATLASVNATITSSGNTTWTVGPPLARTILTHTTVTTLTYTIGTGTSKAERTTKVTHTSTEEMDITSTETVATVTLSAAGTAKDVVQTTEVASSMAESLSSLSVTERSSSSFSSSMSETSSTASMMANSLAAASTTAQSPETLSTCVTAAPPAQTQAGAITGCTKWHVAAAGEYCITVADQFNLSVGTFMAMNPAVEAPFCPNLQAGDAYCVATCDGTVPTATSVLMNSLSSTQSSTRSAMAVITTSVTLTSASETLTTVSTLTSSLTSIAAASSAAAPSASVTAGADVYKTYKGNGSVADGWPAQAQWVEFEANRKLIDPSCDAWGVPRNSDQETEELKQAITDIAESTGVDSRFILATIMQESTGCVRVITTQYSHFNPGLMQSHNGTGTCNTNQAPLGIPGTTALASNVQTPCPDSEIRQQVQDGAGGTSSGDGLKQILAAQVAGGVADVARFYRAARVYNGGSVDPSGDLEKGCCTLCYASDVANRLTGWVSAPHDCSL